MKNNTAIILILLSIGLFYTFISDQYEDVKKLNTLANGYQDVLKNVSAIIELRDNLIVNYEAFPKEEIDRINKILPDNIDTVRLALDLDGIASRHGISIKSIQTMANSDKGLNRIALPENEESYGKVTISLGFISNYDNFTNFLDDIEKSLRIMDVKSISFQTGDSNLYDYQVSIDTYWLK